MVLARSLEATGLDDRILIMSKSILTALCDGPLKKVDNMRNLLSAVEVDGVSIVASTPSGRGLTVLEKTRGCPSTASRAWTGAKPGSSIPPRSLPLLGKTMGEALVVRRASETSSSFPVETELSDANEVSRVKTDEALEAGGGEDLIYSSWIDGGPVMLEKELPLSIGDFAGVAGFDFSEDRELWEILRESSAASSEVVVLEIEVFLGVREAADSFRGTSGLNAGEGEGDREAARAGFAGVSRVAGWATRGVGRSGVAFAAPATAGAADEGAFLFGPLALPLVIYRIVGQ